jgi:hypothetical protein
MKPKNHSEELQDINKKISLLSNPSSASKHKSYAVYALFFVILAGCLSTIIYFGPEITGFVTFSESFSRAETGSFSVARSKSVNIKTELENIDSVMLSGTVYGSGSAAVYVVKPDRKYLAYYFEGDAGEGVKFSDMCYDTCHIDALGKDNVLLFELENMRIEIDKIRYVYSRLIDFALEPMRNVIDYRTEQAKIINLKLTNSQLAEFSVLLYVEGPLSSSFSWQGSLIHVAQNESEKIIPITVKLPSNLQKGIYTQKLSARYIPPGNSPFVGESPVAESFITIYNE